MKVEVEITGIEEDILKEIINIGFAKVADSFAIMAKQQVLIQVPKVEMVPIAELDAVLPENKWEDSVVQSDIQGDMKAKNFLIFKQRQAMKLSDICIGCENDFAGNYNAMRKSLLLETSNILTGALLTQFANIFNMSLCGTPPVAVPYTLRKTFADLIQNLITFKPIVLTVKTQFLNIGEEIELPMVLVLDINSMFKILSAIRKRNQTDLNWLAHNN